MAVIVTLLDNATACGEGVYTYDNDALAYTKIRRSVREAYINGEVDNDWIIEHCFAIVGSFDFGPYDEHKSSEGDFNGEATAVTGYSQVDWIIWNCISFVSDIYETGGEDDN